MAWSRHRAISAAAGVLIASSLLVACGGADDAQPHGTTATAGFPVTLQNTFGRTVVPAKPERIVTLGWNAQDIVHALGETPIAMPKVTYGATAAGVSAWDDWFDPAKTELLDTGDKYPFEKIAALKPDVILAPYEGFDKATYDVLSGIAPTVAYPGAAWQTTWQDQTLLIGEALGKKPQAEKLIADLNDKLEQVAAEHPEFKGKTLSVGSFGTDNWLYLPGDPRVQILNQLGFVNAPGVTALQAKNTKNEFAVPISKERVSDAHADVVVAFLTGMKPAEFAADPLYASLGGAYALDDQQVISGMSSVSVLSVPWVLGKIVPGLSEAAQAAS